MQNLDHIEKFCQFKIATSLSDSMHDLRSSSLDVADIHGNADEVEDDKDDIPAELMATIRSLSCKYAYILEPTVCTSPWLLYLDFQPPIVLRST